jgi:hypothetical protein
MQDKTDAKVPQDASTQEGSVPFFTRFLEGQNSDNPQSDGGNSNRNELLQTLKYPSDRDEDDFR